jgi:SAM-dependent methyltransferase
MEKESQLPALSKWFETSTGKYYLKYEQEALNSFLPLLKGFYLVQLGLVNVYDLKCASPIMQRVFVDKEKSSSTSNNIIEANFSDLPFQYESVDCFLLPHTLEYTQNPENLINQLYNILIPGGRLVILGFNSFSFFGLTKLLKFAKNIPWSGKLYRVGQVKSLLGAYRFEIDEIKFLGYKPPLNREPGGKLFLPRWRSIYLFIAQKKAQAVTPLTKKIFVKKIPVASGFPEPSTHKG